MDKSSNLDSSAQQNDAQKYKSSNSLIQMFSSPYFTIDLALIYLYKHRREKTIFEYLVNKLYSYPDEQIEYYLPQFCFMLIKSEDEALEKFFFDKCLQGMPWFLKIYWTIKAYGQAERKYRKKYEYVELLLTRIETSMVNGPVNHKIDDLMKSLSVNKNPTQDEIGIMLQEAEKKNHRADYFNQTLRFINVLVSISLKIKDIKPENRKAILRDCIKRLNKWLVSHRVKHLEQKHEQFKKLFYGIHLPLGNNLSADKSTQVVRILEDEITCFNTKKRAPYRIVFETIDMEEALSSIGNNKIQQNPYEHEGWVPHGHEENFADILSEHENWESNPHQQRIIEQNYGALIDFNKMLREQELKLKDAQLLKEVDLTQKMMILNKATPTKSNGYSKPSRITKTSTLQEFNTIFPIHKNLTRRKSFDYRKIDFDDMIIIPRKASFIQPTELERISLLEKFREESLPEQYQERAERTIEEMKTIWSSKKKKKQRKMSNFSPPLRPETRGWGPWDELWEYRQEKIRKLSPFGHFKSYKLRPVIIKAADDLRQELITMQILKKFEQIWKDAGLKLAIRTYNILVTSDDSGILEFVPDTYSIDSLKKRNPDITLIEFFKETYGYSFEEAQKNFMDSLAAYCLVCYLLQIKDRHNGNILLDAYGHLVHIDFGFIFSTNPGGINFESAPFKLTKEYEEIIGGVESPTFMYFKVQLCKGFLELRKHVEQILYIVHIMREGSDLPCFEDFDMQVFRERFMESYTDLEVFENVDRLIEQSLDNWRTVQYDNFQKLTNGILP